MAQQVAQIPKCPKYVAELMSALQKLEPGAKLDVERRRGRGGYQYTIAVMSDRFESRGWRERHKRLWDAMYETLTDDQLGRVAVIALRPSDLNGE